MLVCYYLLDLLILFIFVVIFSHRASNVTINSICLLSGYLLLFSFADYEKGPAEMNLMEKFIVFCVVLQFVSAIKDNSKDFIFCAKVAGSITHISEDGGPEEISTESPDQKCVKSYCYTLWKEDPYDGTRTIMGQGKINICIRC